jgi:ABC-type dipeptide/oligopeptide/nickel transport system permease component
MGKYILKRLLMMIPVILAVAILIFTIMTLVPGNPASLILGADATEEQILAKEHELGLDQPFFIRLFQYLKQVFIDFDFGTSYWTNTSVTDELIERFPRTLTIAGFAMLFTVIIGIPLGIRSAVHEGTWTDRLTVLLCVIGVSLPTFWFAMLLVLLFSLKLGWLPAQGLGGPQYYIMPIFAQSLGGISGMVRISRASMLEVIRADYVTTARSKGLSERKVIYNHVLPNAMLPIISVLSGQLANQLGGALVIEQVFSIPGIGMYLINAVNTRDYPVAQSSVVFLSILFSFIVLLADLCYAAVDPTIKAQFTAQGKGKKKLKLEESKS